MDVMIDVWWKVHATLSLNPRVTESSTVTAKNLLQHRLCRIMQMQCEYVVSALVAQEILEIMLGAK